VAEVSDAPFCRKCGHEYVYDYVTYGHLGAYRCPDCGCARPEPQVSVSEVVVSDAEHSEVVFRDGEKTYPAVIGQPGGYNIYNACSAMACGNALGLDPAVTAKALSAFSCGFGRMEKFTLNGTDVRMILIKNPAGCNQVLNFLAQMQEPFVFAVCLSDHVQDGRDVSWIWDTDFERLCAMDMLSEIYVSGVRAEDMALRFKYAGIASERLHIVKDEKAFLEAATAQKKPVFIMPTYTAMLSLRATVSKVYGYQKFWQ
jgi:UDP-N-acetylmuramyl tripeptide synthase